MAWQDRLKQAAYTSPGGTRTEFTYEEVERNLELRGTRYSFPDQQGTFIQDTGSSGRSFPFRVIIAGDNYDLTADAFFESLREPGVGTLEHPLYGTIDVVPLGSIVQVDPLKNAAGQALFEVTFWETINVIFPQAIQSGAGLLSAAINGFRTQFSADWSTLVDVDTQIELVDLISNAETVFNTVRNGVRGLASSSDVLIDEFTDIADEMESSFNSVDFSTERFPSQLQQLSSFGSTASNAWDDVSNSYDTIVTNVIGTAAQARVVTQTRDSRARNKVLADYLAVSTATADLAASAITSTFTTRPQAIIAAQTLVDLSTRVTVWQEVNYTETEIVDTGEIYQQWQEAIALAAGYLVELAFSLDQERVIFLDRPRSVIDLTAELYNDASNDQLDFFLRSNDVTGDEMLEGLPVGRRVVYYG